MSLQHKNLTTERWSKLSFFEQMANVGSEVERALDWRAKNNAEYAQQACARALELIDLTLETIKRPSHFKEIARLRESLVDYFFGSNQFRSAEKSWHNYFSHFTYAARRNH